MVGPARSRPRIWRDELVRKPISGFAEGDADPPFLAPDDAAGMALVRARDHQRDVLGDSNGACDVEGGAAGEILRTTQSIAPPLNSMVPLFKTRLRPVSRLSMVLAGSGECLAIHPLARARNVTVTGANALRNKSHHTMRMPNSS
jgi:hypothetical protein